MFREKIEKLFGDVEEYTEYPTRGEVEFVVKRAEFNAEKLFALSDALGTGTIEIETETRNDGYCETCSYEYGVMVMTAKGVKF